MSVAVASNTTSGADLSVNWLIDVRTANGGTVRALSSITDVKIAVMEYQHVKFGNYRTLSTTVYSTLTTFSVT